MGRHRAVGDFRQSQVRTRRFQQVVEHADQQRDKAVSAISVPISCGTV
jgi:hypothetical protein